MVEGDTIAVVIPCFRIGRQILSVIDKIPQIVNEIFVVDDGCPLKTGEIIMQENSDPRVRVIFHAGNKGIGAAMKTGYTAALASKHRIVVKMDGDGQMDPDKILKLTMPLTSNRADYAKGNRFSHPQDLQEMPKVRLFGNLALSLFAKVSTGYWHIFDPNNGFTAINSNTLEKMELSRVSNGYFFESDMLFNLGKENARVIDVPIAAIYKDEVSNLSVSKSIVEFAIKHLRNTIERMQHVSASGSSRIPLVLRQIASTKNYVSLIGVSLLFSSVLLLNGRSLVDFLILPLAILFLGILRLSWFVVKDARFHIRNGASCGEICIQNNGNQIG